MAPREDVVFRIDRLVIASFLAVFLGTSSAQQPLARSATIALRDLLPPSDPLAAQNLTFDVSFAREAIEYSRSNDAALIERIASSPAIDHILNHARNFDYDVPQDSRMSLVRNLLDPVEKRAQRTTACQRSLEYFTGPMQSDPHWINDALAYLPSDFHYQGSLFLTFGYDIGVAYAPNASLNCTHSHFDDHPRELLYYAIHELHHVGFMTFQKPPALADIRSCADLLSLVEYSTQLEGMAVVAAYQRRQHERALQDDSDYVALDDARGMQADLASYFKDYEYLKSRGIQPADKDAWAVIDRMSAGERLWYRVGAYMAQRIEASKGRSYLVALIKQGPAQFLAAYRSLRVEPPR